MDTSDIKTLRAYLEERRAAAGRALAEVEATHGTNDCLSGYFRGLASAFAQILAYVDDYPTEGE